MTSDDEPILRVDDLKKYYRANDGFIENLIGSTSWVKAVDGVSFELHEGETLGVVGESGCGKSTLGRSLLQLVEPTEGSVYYRDADLTELSNSEMRDIRTDIQYIFQDPFSSLNPKMTVGDIIGEPLDVHNIASGDDREDRIYDLLETVGLNPSHAQRYPHEFSGGQRQRIGIARALAVDPEIIICDEPVSALDVSVQAQILNLLEDLQTEFNLSYIFIAHDLSVVEHISDRVAVMYLGSFAEVGSTTEVFQPPYHPYSEALLSAIPEPDPLWEGDRIILPGTVPSPIDPPTGCRFHTRCPRVIEPEGYEFEDGVWRSLMTFKLRVRNAEILEGVVSLEGAEEVDEGHRDSSDVDPDALWSAIRDEFGFPESFSDPSVEAVIDDVIKALAAGNIEAASEDLEAAFESPCEHDRPDQYTVGDSHRISCLLYDDAYAGDGVYGDTDDVGGTGNVAADD
ncbi:ATP-binding cassette domain-containing protein [Natronolimnobius sp. AArcel1]|uniref:ABC transporter ATP-binding protein n=1 Tax=Natronolimnobius sp. AArcel1 TaxID=1679093 RepID=UPI0013EBDFE8|nr:oligopeptide/dipeptide ABC transporter ATP-binding protein [Natronolimnobius sp. AArcel1]NGM69754.1 ATP-binding cassette domain-containing protein [Natronolimnobius sp. AArcel1]